MRIALQRALGIQLNLTEKDALWLRAFLQNPQNENETAEDYYIRERIFESLRRLLK